MCSTFTVIREMQLKSVIIPRITNISERPTIPIIKRQFVLQYHFYYPNLKVLQSPSSIKHTWIMVYSLWSIIQWWNRTKLWLRAATWPSLTNTVLSEIVQKQKYTWYLRIALPFSIPTSSVWVTQLIQIFYILSSIWDCHYFLVFNFSCSNTCVGISHPGLNLHFPDG